MEEWILQKDFYQKAMVICIVLAIVLAIIAVVLWIVFDLQETVRYAGARRIKGKKCHRNNRHQREEKRILAAETEKKQTSFGAAEAGTDSSGDNRELYFHLERKILLAYSEEEKHR